MQPEPTLPRPACRDELRAQYSHSLKSLIRLQMKTFFDYRSMSKDDNVSWPTKMFEVTFARSKKEKVFQVRSYSYRSIS